MPLDPTPFAGRVIVVTGGARGLGYAAARELAERGADLALLDLLPGVEEAAVRLAVATGRRTVGAVCDVTDQASIEAALDTAYGALGAADHLVAAAGIAHNVAALDATPADFRRVVDINLTGTFLTCQAVARRLVAARRQGSMVNFGSMSGYVANRPQDQAAYNASKAGVTMLTKSLAVEWQPYGIRVNSIAPGYMASDMTKQYADVHPEVRAEWERRTPMGRMGQPEELAGLICFLLSDEASFITGQDYLVDGGYTLV